MTANEIISILRSNCAGLRNVMSDEEMDGIQEATETAIAAIHYRTAVAPSSAFMNSYGMNNTPGRKVFFCPACKNVLTMQYEYCPKCGQAIDWRDYR